MKPKVVIPLATLCLIFIPMLFISIKMKAFWITSQYDFPFVLIPAFLIGDPIILPLLNYHIYLAVTQVTTLLKKRAIYLTVAYSVLLSTVFNSYTHYLWSHDAFSGVVDPQYGMMSIAGWWHYGVSILQIAIVFTFMVFWLQTISQQNYKTFKAFEKALYILIVFSVVNLSGAFIDKELFLKEKLIPNLVFKNIITGSIPLFTEAVFLWRMRRTYQLLQEKQTMSKEMSKE